MLVSRIAFASSLLLILVFATHNSFGVAQLAESEVNVLRDIAKTIGKRDWNFSVDPCEGEYGWSTPIQVKGFENSVTCNCSFSNGTLCHVTSIVVKAQSLIGTLPPQLGGLPYLQELDLTRNYLNGTIPPEWGSTNLVNISLVGNRLTGPIPKELANITTLKSLVLEYNQLSGALPPELGNLPQIERMLFSSNNFNGELPPTFAKLTTLTDFRISDNHLTGKIPNFIQNWTNIKKIVFQASGLNGPIPLPIVSLRKLTDLRISDINGTEATFPPLDNMIKLTTLILRSCNIVGQLPEYLGEMKSLKNLDLSFNKLSGQIPSSYSNLKNVDNIFLTGNLLSGTVPDWMLKEGDSIDLSYNNFTTVNSATSNCQQRNTNMFASSSKHTSSEIVSCLRSDPCPRNEYSLYVNCGGSDVTVNGTTKYDSDTDMVGSSTFFHGTRNSAANWVLSNTGYFLDHENDKDSYITTNVSRLSLVNPELYVNARISPLSLTYYGYCLENGNYTLKLHFAEIMFTNDTTYRSLGRRIFNVYLQGKLVMKDFNIADEAGGVGKAVIKKFTAVVTSNTLEIRFYWAGKGTTGIPIRGVYGPLISAISVVNDFPPPSAESGNNISVAVVVAVVIGSLLVILLVIVIFWWKCCLKKKNTLEQELKGLDLKTGKFTLRQIKVATNNFDINNKIGEGGFGPVYKGCLSDGTIIAVKQLSSKSKQGNREFLNEIGMISALQHPHLVKLYGCCIEGDQLLLIYEYLENNSVARALFGQKDSQLKLDWPTRHKICVGIARGLAYLHEESRLKIVHRDIKATNVLLDKDLNPKISDFGLAKLDEEEFTHISTRIAGTVGYMAPEYATRGYLTDKADVYSFGIVLLEIVSGRSNSSRPKDDHFNLLDWALFLKEKENLMALVDSKLGSDFNKEEMLITINVALLCTNISPANRPLMSSVVSMLEGRRVLDEFVHSDSLVSTADMKVMRDHYQSIEEGSITDTQTHSISIGGPSVASSSSVPDLYPIINPDSDYWKNRD